MTRSDRSARGEEPGHHPRLKASTKRRLAIAALVGSAIPASLVAISTTVSTPSQALADAQPPAPATITAEVEARQLLRTVVLSALVAADTALEIPVPETDGDTIAVLTTEPLARGTEVAPGQVVAVVSGRPIFALPGALPAFRDLQPGHEGPDVEQLQGALSAMGATIEDPVGVFGPTTSVAVEALYEREGLVPRMTPGETNRLREEAEEEVEAATLGLTEAKRQHDLDSRTAETSAVASDSMLRAAAKRAEAARVEGETMVAVANSELAAARRARDRAEVESSSTEQDRDEAEVGVVRAEGALESASAAAELLVADAAAVLDAARAESASQTDEVDRTEVEAANARLDRALQHLEEVERTTGVLLPRAEIVFVPTLPAVVASASGALGSRLTGDEPLLTLTSGELVVVGEAPQPGASQLAPGMESELIDEASGQHFPATVTDVRDPSEERAAVVLTPDSSLPSELIGRPLTVRIVVDATDEAVTAVPISAVRTRADGTAMVTLVSDPAAGTLLQVSVVVGRVADGWVELREGAVDPGMRVVVSP